MVKRLNNKEEFRKAMEILHSAQRKELDDFSITGQGRLASKIIELTNKKKIPIHKDEELMRLLNKLESLERVPESLYDSIAEIMAFMYKNNIRAQQQLMGAKIA